MIQTVYVAACVAAIAFVVGYRLGWVSGYKKGAEMGAILILPLLAGCVTSEKVEEPLEVTFQVTGDYPYHPREIPMVEADITALQDSPASFFVHVGDLNNNSTEGCPESKVAFMRKQAARSDKPVMFVVGDNEWQCCPDPDAGKALWDQYLSNLDDLFGYPWAMERQPERPENWAFRFRGVLFVGLSVPGGNPEPGYIDRLEDDADWVGSQMERGASRACVVFGHSAAAHGENWILFDRLKESINAYGNPVLYIRGDSHVFGWIGNYLREPNAWRMVVSMGGAESPATVTVGVDKENPFEVTRGTPR